VVVSGTQFAIFYVTSLLLFCFTSVLCPIFLSFHFSEVVALPTVRADSHFLACCLVLRVKCLNRVCLSWFAIVYAFTTQNVLHSKIHFDDDNDAKAQSKVGFFVYFSHIIAESEM
jgi:hypothetical protein